MSWTKPTTTKTPAEVAAARHKSSHTRPEQDPLDCWQCGRERARCKSKIRHETPESAQAHCNEVNRIEGYSGRLLIPYRCKWGEDWHYHARTAVARSELRRAQKAYRKLVLRDMAAERGDFPSV